MLSLEHVIYKKATLTLFNITMIQNVKVLKFSF